MIRRAWLAAILLVALLGMARAQVQVTAQTQRTYFLLYERVDLIVTLTNIGNNDLELNNDEGRPWLGFEVGGESVQHMFLPVHAERQSFFAPLTLKMGETKTLRVNLTPLFAFREEGNYRASAVIDLPGEGQVISEPVAFSIQRGHTVVSRVRIVDTLERDYSLIRFSPSADRTDLYLRVESPSENEVYANVGLGELVSAIDPKINFDPQGNVHILQANGYGMYLYTRANADGKILDQRAFKAIQWQPHPQLVKLPDGNVVVEGGLEEDAHTPRDRLSDHQRGDRMDGPASPGLSGMSDSSPVAPPSDLPTRAEMNPPPAEPDTAPAGDPGAAAHRPAGP